MTRHLLKLVWNRKKANALISLEIFLSLLVTCTLTVLATYHWRNHRRPLGFDVERVWRANVGADLRQTPPAELDSIARSLVRETTALDEVEHAALLARAPYSAGKWINRTTLDGGRQIRYHVEHHSPEVREVLGIAVVRGRWFSETDKALHWRPVVVNRSMARAFFGDEDPLCQNLSDPGDGGGPDYRVIGVVEDYRRQGELTPERSVVIMPLRLDDPEELWTVRMVLKMRPGVNVAFEETLVRTLERLAPSWSFTVKALEVDREAYLQKTLAPLLVAAIVAVFLIVMVALGLVGVLWQSVTQRTREMGLRRAKGATARAVRRQILAEVMLLTTFAVILAAAVVVQLPLTGLFATVDFADYALGFAGAAAVIYLLTALCGLYPSWLVTRIRPAEALHYE